MVDGLRTALVGVTHTDCRNSHFPSDEVFRSLPSESEKMRRRPSAMTLHADYAFFPCARASASEHGHSPMPWIAR